MIVETTRALIKMLRGSVNSEVVLSAGSIVEITKLPVLILNGPELTEKKKKMRDPEVMTSIDIESLQDVREMVPRLYDLRFAVNVTCESNLALLEMIEGLSRLNQAQKVIRAVNEDRVREFSWDWRVMAGSDVSPNISQVYQGKGSIVIYDVEVYSNIREYWPLIREIQVDFSGGEYVNVSN